MKEGYVLVTGASGGVGRHLCQRLAAEGLNPVIHYNSGIEPAHELQTAIFDATGITAPLVQANLSTARGISALIEGMTVLVQEHDSSRPLAGVINNAARILGPRFEEITLEQYDEYFNLNVRAPVLVSKDAAGLMAPGGAVVNISSMAATMGQPSNALYAMSKAALESATVHVASALSERGIRVNTVRLGFTDNGNPAFQNPSVMDYVSRYAALGGVAGTENVADAVVYLLRDASRTTGSVLDLTGGTWPRPPKTGESVRKLVQEASKA